MDAANGLIEALSGERDRWTNQSNEFKDMTRRLVGDVALSGAFISYCGPFNAEFRALLFSHYFYQDCIKRKIPVTEDLSVVKFLVDESQITDWQIEGLPTDDHSVQNGTVGQGLGLCLKGGGVPPPPPSQSSAFNSTRRHVRNPNTTPTRVSNRQ